MPLISIDLQQARQTAGTFSSSGNTLDDVCAHLQQQWSALSSTWEGHSKHATEAEVRAVLNQGRHCAEFTRERGAKLTQIADRFQAADENEPFPVTAVAWQAASGAGGGFVLGAATLAAPAPILASMAIADTTQSWLGEIFERIRNWLNGKGWKTDKEQAELEQPVVTWNGQDVKIQIGNDSYDFKHTTYNGYEGHVYLGKLDPSIDQITQKLVENGLPTEDARILAAVSKHEGNFDSIQTYDRAKFSWGFIQFSGAGGLHTLMTDIKKDSPETFQKYFGQNGLDIETDRLVVNKNGAVLSGDAALNELHDNPELWGGFLQASRDPVVQSAQVKAAYDSYYKPIMSQTVNLNGQNYKLGELFKTNDYGRAMLFDRAVQLGPTGAKNLFQEAVTKTGTVDAQRILESAQSLDSKWTNRWTDIKKDF
jgi:WXG100 family type VII secretion target